MVVSTYQAASGAGAAAMEELELQTREVWSISHIYLGTNMRGNWFPSVWSWIFIFFFCMFRYWQENHQHVKYLVDRYMMLFVHLLWFKVQESFLDEVPILQYAFNLFSHNAPILSNGYNEEEMKLVKETRKIWVSYVVYLHFFSFIMLWNSLTLVHYTFFFSEWQGC